MISGFSQNKTKLFTCPPLGYVVVLSRVADYVIIIAPLRRGGRGDDLLNLEGGSVGKVLRFF